MDVGSFTTGTWLLLAAALWIFVSLGVSCLGWVRLVEPYASDAPFDGRRLRFQSGGFAWGAGYNFGLSVGVSEAGLRLSVSPLLRLGHPPLFVPWSDVAAREVAVPLVRRIELRFARAPGVRFRITPRLAAQLAELAPAAWREAVARA